MQPVQFDQVNKVLHGEEGSAVFPLPVCAEAGVVTSAWKPTPQERDLLKCGGLIVLQVMTGSETQPPASLAVIPAPKKPKNMSRPNAEAKVAKATRKANPKKAAKQARREAREAEMTAK